MRRLLFIPFVLIFASLSWAYTPPIGIPDPGAWGSFHPIDTAAPDTATKCPNWPGAATTGCYYIDNSGTCSDTSNPYGYPNNKRCTFPANSYAAGTYIELHGGPYTGTRNLTMSGTSGSPVWLRGTAGSMPTVTGLFSVRNSTYFYIEYIDFNGGNDSAIVVINDNSSGVTNNILIRNSKFRNRGYTGHTSAIGITPYQATAVHDVVIYNNEFSELGDWQGEADTDFHGVNPDTYGKSPPTEEYNIWILNNTFYHLSGNGVQVNANSLAMTPRLHHVYMGKNVGHALRQAPYWTKQGSHIIISQNIAYDNRMHGLQPGNCAGWQYAADNVWFIFNDCYDSSNGIRQSSTDAGTENFSAYVVGNKFHNIHAVPGVDNTNLVDGWHDGNAVDMPNGTMKRYIVDNTIYDVDGGITGFYDTTQTVISGNIISGIGASNYHTWIVQGAAHTTLDHNLLYPAGRFGWNSVSNVYSPLSAFQSFSGTCTVGCATADPLFVNPATVDLHLQAGSPAIDAGVRNSVYDTFYSLYGIDIDVDFDGNPRPATGARSLGAFEYDTGTPPPETVSLGTVLLGR